MVKKSVEERIHQMVADAEPIAQEIDGGFQLKQNEEGMCRYGLAQLIVLFSSIGL